jgi:hypothetical protein
VAFFAAGKDALPKTKVQHENSKQAIIVIFMVAIEVPLVVPAYHIEE